jgi:hypothetical protein
LSSQRNANILVASEFSAWRTVNEEVSIWAKIG